MTIRATILFLAAVVTAPLHAKDEPEANMCDALFVQNAQSIAVDQDTLTMKGVGPMVIYFCDRPVRMAGHLSLEAFLASWLKGKDTFAEDPPNAVLSVLDGDDYIDTVVELTKEPKVNGDELTYAIRVIEGEAPKKGGASSLFIDIVGRPLTPVSVAGAERRRFRRCAAGVTCW
ncbi:MAG: hypothetical protein WAN46_21135 [Gammaproteobacteria bacterium]|jgi:hypothetical protein